MVTAEGSAQKSKAHASSPNDALYAKQLLLENSTMLGQKPKCMDNLNFDAYSTETDTPQNEEDQLFRFLADDNDNLSTSSGSHRNSLQNEERPSAIDLSSEQIPFSQLMQCHFGCELTEKRSSFRDTFAELQRMSADSFLALEHAMPWGDLLMHDFCSLEKILALINVVLLCASLSDSSVDSNVNAVIIYVALAAAYFLGTA